MKTGKILIAALVVSLFNAIFSGVTCGWLFNWVYKLEPVNVWKPMDAPPGLTFYIGIFLLNIVLVLVYALLRKVIPGRNKLTKGFIFGLCVWAIGMLPGMFSIYSFMTVATGVVVYWTLLGLVEMPIKGIIIAAIYGE
ncbi:MAG: hypothetical protein PHI59_08630 [Candidatus Omnitrophica bacterium]|nr:hypothetical protein [Candidatus Omnitrophota bacterium]